MRTDELRPPDWLTPAWLTRALRDCGGPMSTNVATIRPELIGDFSNRLWRLHLTYDASASGETPPASIVLKHPRPDRVDDAGLSDEIRFYQELGAQLPIRTPRLCIADGEHLRLGLEDLTHLEPVHFVEGATVEHLHLAADALAELHTAFWRRVAEVSWIPSFGDARYRADLEREYERDWPDRRSTLAEIAPDFVPLGDRLRGRIAEAVTPLGADETLLHGDAHFENLALTRDADGVASVLFHDWGGVRLGSASFDVAVLIVMSLPVERRRELEQSLVARHADALRSAGVRLEDPWLGYQRGVLAWAIRMVQFSKHALTSPGLRLVTQRTAMAAVDHRVDELLA